MKMYRGRKSRGEDPLRKARSASALPSSAILEGATLRFFALPFVLGLLFFFFFNACPYSSFPLAIRPLVLSSLVLQRLQIYPGPLKVARSLSVLQRTTVSRQSSHSHRRYLPSGINQLNARLLEASLSLKPILLAFLCFPILFPPARRVRGEAAIRLICRLLIQLAFLPSVYTGHPKSSSPSSLTTSRAHFA